METDTIKLQTDCRSPARKAAEEAWELQQFDDGYDHRPDRESFIAGFVMGWVEGQGHAQQWNKHD